MEERSFMQLLYHSQQVLQRCLDLLFPLHCTVCQRGGSILCAACLAQIQPLAPPFCPRCNAALIAAQGICRSCRYHPLALSGLRAASTYQDPLRSCIHALKYSGQTRLAQPLGSFLARTYTARQMQADMLVPVPLHSSRQRERGYNQSQLLAEACAHELGLPIYSQLLIRTRATSAQARLEAKERRNNVAGAFICNPTCISGTLHNRSIALIDDVCTTGATLEACAAALFAAGASSVWGLVLARPATR